MSPSQSLLVWIYLLLQQSQSILSNKWNKTTGPNGEDIWKSTSWFQAGGVASYGTIKIGQIMEMEFDFRYMTRNNTPTAGAANNFFRIGHTGSGGGCSEGTRYPSLWLAGNTEADRGPLLVSYTSGSQCDVSKTLWGYEQISKLDDTDIWTHITITIDWSNVTVDIYGGDKDNYTISWNRDLTIDAHLGNEVPIWFGSDGGYNIGTPKFRRIKITSSVFTNTFPPSLTPTAQPTTTLPTSGPTTALPTSGPITSAPNTTPLPTTVSVDDAPVNKEEDDYVTMIIIIAVCVVGLGAICFVIFCVFRWKKNKDDSDDEEESEGDMETTGARGTIDYNATTNPTEPQRETRYSMSNNPVAQPPTVSMTNYNNQYTQQGPVHQPVQVTQSGPMYPQQLYSKANMMQNAPSQAQYSNANMMQNAPSQQQYSNPNMMQQAPPQQQQQMNSQYANQLQPQQASNMNQFAAQNAQQIVASQVSQLSMNSDGTDVSLYEKQAEYAQQEMKEKEKSTRSILSANTDVSLYETQQRYSQQEQKELGQLDEVQEVDTFASYQGAPEPARRMSDATTATDVSLYETQQQYLQEEMEEINERRSVSKRKSSRV
eukprot:139002_1